MMIARCGGGGELITIDGVASGNSTGYYLGWVDRVKSVSENGVITYISQSTYIDSTAFGDMVGYGFFFMTLIILVSTLFGDRAPMQVSFADEKNASRHTKK